MQAHVITQRQARLGGLSKAGWDWRLARGRWQSPLPGVGVAHNGELTDEQRARAALLYAGEGAALSGDAALVQHGMTLMSVPVIHVAVPAHRRVTSQVFRGRPAGGRDVVRPISDDSSDQEPAPATSRSAMRAAAQDGVRVRGHRVHDLHLLIHPSKQPTVVRIAPAVLHAAAWAPADRAAEWRVAAAVQQRLVRPDDLVRQLELIPRLPRRALLRTVLLDVQFGAHAASELEFLRFLTTYGLPRPDKLQLPVRLGTVRFLDAWWERQRVSAELDGAHHRDVSTWGKDALRANDVQIGARDDRVLTLRFTTGSLRHDAARVAAQLRDALL